MKFINRKVVWLILSLILFSLQANAQEKTFDESVLSESGKQAYQTLLKIDIFALGGVGYSGSTSEGELALYELSKDREAVEAFKSILNNATIEGQIYALLGVRILKCDCFQSELGKFKTKTEFPKVNNRRKKSSDDIVTTMSGCLVFGKNRTEIIQDIETGKYDELIE